MLDRLLHLLVGNRHPMLSQLFRRRTSTDRHGADVPDLVRVDQGDTGELGIMGPEPNRRHVERR